MNPLKTEETLPPPPKEKSGYRMVYFQIIHGFVFPSCGGKQKNQAEFTVAWGLGVFSFPVLLPCPFHGAPQIIKMWQNSWDLNLKRESVTWGQSRAYTQPALKQGGSKERRMPFSGDLYEVRERNSPEEVYKNKEKHTSAYHTCLAIHQQKSREMEKAWPHPSNASPGMSQVEEKQLFMG